MLRLTLLLIAAMALAWTTLGRDSGQLRPGLAKAAAEGRLDAVWAEARARDAARSAAETDPEGAYYVTRTRPDPQPLPAPAPLLAGAEPPKPSVIVAPVREVVQALVDPVFSLQSFGNEPVPGADQPRTLSEAAPEAMPEAATAAEALPEPAAADQGQVWYVVADQVNVRAGPSTDAAILGKLVQGDDLLLVETVDGDWARISIQGDGIEGFVATRFLSPVAP